MQHAVRGADALPALHARLSLPSLSPYLGTETHAERGLAHAGCLPQPTLLPLRVRRDGAAPRESGPETWGCSSGSCAVSKQEGHEGEEEASSAHKTLAAMASQARVTRCSWPWSCRALTQAHATLKFRCFCLCRRFHRRPRELWAPAALDAGVPHPRQLRPLARRPGADLARRGPRRSASPKACSHTLDLRSFGRHTLRRNPRSALSLRLTLSIRLSASRRASRSAATLAFRQSGAVGNCAPLADVRASAGGRQQRQRTRHVVRAEQVPAIGALTRCPLLWQPASGRLTSFVPRAGLLPNPGCPTRRGHEGAEEGVPPARAHVPSCESQRTKRVTDRSYWRCPERLGDVSRESDKTLAARSDPAPLTPSCRT